MTKFERLIEDALSYEEAMKAPRRPLSAKAKAAILAGVDETFGPSFQILPTNAVRAVPKRFLELNPASRAKFLASLGIPQPEIQSDSEDLGADPIDRMISSGLIVQTDDKDRADPHFKITANFLELLRIYETTSTTDLG